MGGVYRFKDGREVPDHVFATFEYPGGITGTFSSVESNAFEERYEAFYGTKGTLIIRNENEAMLFDEGDAARADRRRGAPKGRRAARDRRRPSRSKAGGAPPRTAQRAGAAASDLAEHLRDQRVLPRRSAPARRSTAAREGVALRELDDRRQRGAEDGQTVEIP
jgi:predicted dehydrogenase